MTTTALTIDGCLIHPDPMRRYPEIDHGDGVYLVDRAGRRYLDGASGALVANLGHGVPQVVKAIQAQARRVAFVYRSQFTSAPAEELARRLARHSPGDLRWTLLTNSGSEATEAALRMAVTYWAQRGQPRRTRVIGRDMSYHGMTLGALSMSGHAARRARFEPLLHPFATAPAPHCHRCPFGKTRASCAHECLDPVEDQLRGDEVAAVIVEPVVGAAGGALDPRPGYLERLRQLCDAHGVLLIADEIITGFGRTGRWFACEHDGVVPDLLVVGKGMSAGFVPVAGVIVRDDIASVLLRSADATQLAHTYSAFPLGAAACLSVLDYIERHDLVAAAAARGAELRAALFELAARHPLVVDVRGKGLLFGLELDPERLCLPTGTELTRRLVDHAFAERLIVYPAGRVPGNQAVLVAPPLTIRSHEIQELADRLDRAVAALERDLRSRPAIPIGRQSV